MTEIEKVKSEIKVLEAKGIDTSKRVKIS